MKSKLIVATCIFLLTGCSPFQPIAVSPKTTYLLNDPTIGQNDVMSHSKKNLLVSIPSAPRWLNTSEMAYQTSSSEINYYAENEWAAPPALMLEPIIAHALSQSGLYGVVVQAPFGGNADRRLDVQIITMQQDFTKNPSVYNLVLQAQLINMVTGDIIRGQRFSYTIPTETNNPAGGVKAANKAIEEWIPQLIAFCRKSPANT
ncbi:MAG TPA: ABC-type transport auxiliary lipoprotein family protein [Gammaproteobacteria bacterium]|nr:ABC-type transport auxiliary lipoprotein family protein [Gammaproteobacteria bacterium]